MHASRTIVVVPCYNEEQRLDLTSYRRFLKDNTDCDVLFVNDGSTDKTEQVLAQLRNCFPNTVSILSLPQNCGKAEAVRRGILTALTRKPVAVAYWDADLATPLDEIPRFRDTLHRLDRVKLVIGCRIRLAGHEIYRKPIRRAAGSLFSFATSLVLSTPIRDTQCGAKMFRVTPGLARIFDCPFSSRWIFDVEVLTRLCESPGFDNSAIFELPVAKWQEVGGSRLKFQDCLNAVWELLLVGWNYRIAGRARRKLSLASSTGPSCKTREIAGRVSVNSNSDPSDLTVAKTPGRAA
jgi:dolichyl-phosphate beta-glucosyltransferase